MYDYNFRKADLYKQRLIANENETEQTELKAIPESEIEPYSGLTNLRFNNFAPWIGSGLIGPYGSAAVSFSDPLEHHAVTFGAAKTSADENIGYVLYGHDKWALAWYLGHIYQEKNILNTDQDEVLSRSVIEDSFIGARLKMFRSGRWSSDWWLEVGHQDDQRISTGPFYSTTSWFDLDYSHGLPLGFSAYRTFNATMGYRSDATSPSWTKTEDSFTWSLFGSQDVWSQTYVTMGIQQAWAGSSTLSLSSSMQVKEDPFFIPYFFTRRKHGVF